VDAIQKETFVQVVTELFSEAYEGPQHAYTWFVDNDPGAGLLGTLARLPAEAASRPTVPGGATIAAHAEHLRWSLAMANAFARGEQPQAKWAESWSVRTVDATSWERLQADLKREFDTLKAAIQANPNLSGVQVLTGILALIPHAAYHLGAVRQMARVLGAEAHA